MAAYHGYPKNGRPPTSTGKGGRSRIPKGPKRGGYAKTKPAQVAEPPVIVGKGAAQGDWGAAGLR